MLRFLKSFFSKKNEPTAPAPYKIEAPLDVGIPEMIPPAPEPVKCGCGRSSSGFCVGLHKLTAEEWSNHPDNPAKAEVKPKTKSTAKPRAEKKPAVPAIKAAKKPRAKKS